VVAIHAPAPILLYMKTNHWVITALGVILLSCLPVGAQQQTAPAPQTAPSAQPAPQPGQPAAGNVVNVMETIPWLAGNWQGEGVQQGVTFTSQFSVTSELDGVLLIIRRTTTGGFKDLMSLAFDKGGNQYVGTIFDNQRHIGLFLCQVSPNQVVCRQQTGAGGLQSQRTIRQLDANSISFVIEAGQSGQQMKRTVEITYRKQP